MKNFITEEITFTVDGFRLRGVLSKPHRAHPPVVIGSHGLLSGGDSPKQISLARACNQKKIAFFRFDHRGCGQSEGVFEQVTTLNARCNDLMAAIAMIQARDDLGDHIGLFGSSLGGAVCISAAARIKVAALVIVATPIRSRELEHVARSSDQLGALPREFYQNNLPFDIADKLAALHTVLIFHGDHDAIVPAANAHEIMDNAGEPKKLIIQPNGDHRMSNPRDQKEFIRRASSWFETYMKPG